MKVHTRAACAALLGAVFTVAGCGKTEGEVEIPSLNDPVKLEVQQEASTDSFGADDSLSGLPSLPGAAGDRPLETPATPSSTP